MYLVMTLVLTVSLHRLWWDGCGSLSVCMYRYMLYGIPVSVEVHVSRDDIGTGIKPPSRIGGGMAVGPNR